MKTFPRPGVDRLGSDADGPFQMTPQGVRLQYVGSGSWIPGYETMAVTRSPWEDTAKEKIDECGN